MRRDDDSFDDPDDSIDDLDDISLTRADRPRVRGAPFATLIPYRNGPALGAYYCGVFGLIPIVGFVLGPIAFVLGILGLRKRARQPQVGGLGHALAGIVLGILGPLVWVGVVIWVSGPIR